MKKKLQQNLRKYKSRDYLKRLAREALTNLLFLTILLLVGNYFINVKLPVDEGGISAEDRQDLHKITAYRLQKQKIIFDNLKGVALSGKFDSRQVEQGKITLLAFSQWMHLVVLQNQVRYEPAKVRKYHEEISFYRESRLFEVTAEQGREIRAYKERDFAEARQKFARFNFKEFWYSLDSGLRMLGLQLQTTVNPNLKRFAGNPTRKEERVLRWYDQIVAMAAKYRLEPALVAALIEQESGGNPDAISHAGAVGLMQLMPRTARGLGVNPFDPIQNLEGGTKYISIQLKRFGNLQDALIAYNAGPSRVGQPLFAETRGYIRNVPRLVEKYRPYFNNRKVIDIKPWLNKKKEP